jgi:hypothetical protein
MYVVSKRISSAVWFSSWIIILLVEYWIDFIVPVWVCGVVWARRIRRRVPMRDKMNVVFCRFILAEEFFVESDVFVEVVV